MDTFSTIIATQNTGFEKESNEFYRSIYTDSGLLSFIAAKVAITIGFAVSAYIIQLYIPELRMLYIFIAGGLVCVGVFVTTSNFSAALSGNSINVYSMNALQFSIFGLFAFLLSGIVFSIIRVINDHHDHRAKKVAKIEYENEILTNYTRFSKR